MLVLRPDVVMGSFVACRKLRTYPLSSPALAPQGFPANALRRASRNPLTRFRHYTVHFVEPGQGPSSPLSTAAF